MTQPRPRSLPRLGIVAAVVLGCVGCDQTTKTLARRLLPEAEVWSFLGDALRLQLAHNEGAFLGLGAALPELWRVAIFSGTVPLVLLGVLVYTLRSRRMDVGAIVGLSLVFAGGISNFMDRLLHAGRVVDFLNLGLGPLRTGIFNVADVAIVAGTLLLCVPRARRAAPPCAAQEDRDTPPHGERD